MYYRIKNFLERLFRRRKIFLISDLHLDHKNIIKYCHRPFRSVKQMNRTIVRNWNRTVSKSDFVYFLGDMSFGRGSRPASYWLKKLNGRIHFIEGSHDRTGFIPDENFSWSTIYKGYHFLLIHNPYDGFRKRGRGVWIIHGHKHNNDMKNFPFINGKRKTINVSVELLNYKPLLIDDLLKLDINKIKRMNKINSKPVYFRKT